MTPQMIKLYLFAAVVAALVLACAGLGTRLYFAKAEIADLKLSIEQAKTESERQYKEKLASYIEAGDKAIQEARTEAKNRKDAYDAILALSQLEKDHADRAARSIVVHINGLLDRANQRYGANHPTHSASSIIPRSASFWSNQSGSHEYTDVATALEDVFTWCEANHQRVLTIAEFQKAALSR